MIQRDTAPTTISSLNARRYADLIRLAAREIGEPTASFMQSSDDITESIELPTWNEDALKSWRSLDVLQDPSNTTDIDAYGTQLEKLAKKIEELKYAISCMTEQRPHVIGTKIYSLPSPDYELTTPLDVTVEIHQDEVVALIPDLELYGEGRNQIEAINELKLELLDLYDDLEEMTNEELGEYPQAWKKTLQRLVKKCQ